MPNLFFIYLLITILFYSFMLSLSSHVRFPTNYSAYVLCASAVRHGSGVGESLGTHWHPEAPRSEGPWGKPLLQEHGTHPSRPHFSHARHHRWVDGWVDQVWSPLSCLSFSLVFFLLIRWMDESCVGFQFDGFSMDWLDGVCLVSDFCKYQMSGRLNITSLSLSPSPEYSYGIVNRQCQQYSAMQ